MAPNNPSKSHGSDGERLHNDFYFTNLFRVLQGATYTAMAFSALALTWVKLDWPLMARATALAYLLFAVAVLLTTRRWLPRVQWALPLFVLVDIAAATLAIVAMADARTGIAMMLIINISGAALMLPLQRSLMLAAIASATMIGRTVLWRPTDQSFYGALLEVSLFGLAYFGAAWLCFVLARQMRATEALATQRGVDLANLSQVNELIIRRMRTGVLLVDDNNHIHQINESAWILLGSPPAKQRDLGLLAPELSRRLYRWRTAGYSDESSVSLAEGVPEVVPRFTRLSPNDDSNLLIFLDDTSLVSRRAEELTLASLGRLSASIAHEIRNPLTAIDYSAQLLAESEDLDPADQRMVEIITNHSRRLNEIIENILQLSRRERSRSEPMDLNAWALSFIDEYTASNDLGNDTLNATVQTTEVAAVADGRQLHQVVWNLVQNALRYGRMPNEPARVMITVRHHPKGTPVLEVSDRGPGIPPKVAERIFEPFFTTHELGTGLGLYLSRQMCEANQASLDYFSLPGGGSCFRISLTPPARISGTR